MLHILLIILKIAGIILAVILGILVLLVCIVLFVPICYRGEAKTNGTLEDIRAHGQISWLFGLVRAVVDVRNKSPDFYIKIAWKSIGGRSESTQKEEENKKNEEINGYEERKKSEESEEAPKEGNESRRKDSENGETESALGKKKDTKGYCSGEELKDSQKTSEKSSEASEGRKEGKNISEEESGIQKKDGKDIAKIYKEEPETGEEPARSRQKRVSFSGRIAEKLRGFIRKFVQKITQTIDKFKCTIRKLCDRIEAVSDKKDKLAAFITDETHKRALGKGRKEFIRLLGHLSPKVFEADIHYGFEDPSLTGKVLAGFGILYPFLGEHARITPDFQEKILEGSLYIKGRIYAVHLAALAVKLLLDGNVRRTVKDVRKFKL